MKKVFFSVLLAICLIFPCGFLLTGCGESEVNDIYISSNFYDEGEQELSVYISNSSDTTFLSTISTKDIRFQGDLLGRTATKVTYVSNTCVKITLGGKCSVSSRESNLNKLTITKNATSADSNSVCVVSRVYASGLESSDNSTSAGVYTSYFSATDGASLVEDNLIEINIVVINGDGNENLTITLEADGRVKIEISNFTADANTGTNPKVTFSAITTSLNKAITVSVG